MKQPIKNINPGITPDQILQYFANCANTRKRIAENRKRLLNETIEQALKGRKLVMKMKTTQAKG